MSHIIKQKKSKTPPLSNAQKTFNRLKKKIGVLQEEIEKIQKRFDEALVFYYEKMEPELKVMRTTSIEFIKVLHGHYEKKSKSLNKKERKMLKELILDKAKDVLESATFSEGDPELRAIFKELGGVDYEEIALDQFKSFQQQMEETLRDEGIDIDLSQLNFADDKEEIKQKIWEAMREAAENFKEKEEPAAKPKSKKEIEKEKKAQELEDLQKKGLSSIYKQLAKAFHPDLEPDPKQKIEKEQLMKKLTNAYENDDLHTLLSLEMEWMSRSNQTGKVQGEDKLKIYNSILKDQVDALQYNLQDVISHPKYTPLHAWQEEIASSGRIALQRQHQNLKKDIHEFQDLIQNLKSKEGNKLLHSILQDYVQMKEVEELYMYIDDLFH